MFVSAVALLSFLCTAPLAAPAATDTLSPPVSDADLVGWVAQSLISDVRGRPESEDEWLARTGRVNDLAIAREVSGRLAAAGLHDLVVGCSDGGHVSLRGRGNSDARRQEATRLAAAVPGVRAVDNLLRLPGEPVPVPPAPAPAAPAPAAGPACSEAFDFLTPDAMAGHDIIVEVADGVVTLSGMVNSDAARVYATAAAHRVPGVRSVFNTLAVRPRNTLEDRGMALLVQSRIENSVRLKSVAPAITVSAVNGVVQLRGTVHTEAQRLEAETLALDTQIVFAVSSALVVDATRLVPPSPRLRDFRLWTPY